MTRDLAGAIASFHKALACDPALTSAHVNLGQALKARGDLAGAIACYRKALEHGPRSAQVYGALGQALLLVGRFSEARQATAEAVKLAPPGQPLHFVVQGQLQQCEQLLALDQHLAAVQKGQAQPANAAEQLALAELCRIYKKQYATAAEFYAVLFAAAPNLARDLTKSHRYKAACVAALAAAGQGKDADKLDAPAKVKLRQQALEWLRADLELWQQKTKGKEPKELEALTKQLTQWQTDADLAGVREAKGLAALPEAERKEWQALWADVGKLLQRARP